LVSCVIGLDERFRPSMTSTNIGLLFSTRVDLYCHTSFLSIKHADVLESKSVWTSIIISLLHLTMISTKKHGVGSENKMGPFSLWIGNRNGVCCMWSMLIWALTSNMTCLSTIQKKIVCISILFLLVHEGFESYLINLHGVVL
jgi:hypothetical protein